MYMFIVSIYPSIYQTNLYLSVYVFFLFVCLSLCLFVSVCMDERYNSNIKKIPFIETIN